MPGLGVERLIWGLGLDGGVAGWSEGVLVTGYKVSEREWESSGRLSKRAACGCVRGRVGG